MVNKAELTHEILKYVAPLEKGRSLDPVDAVGCAKLILKLENERRRLAVIADAAETLVKGRDADWKELVAKLQKDNTALRKLVKDIASSFTKQVQHQEASAEKWRSAAEALSTRNHITRLPK